MQSLAKYCVKADCSNTHIPNNVCSVLSSQLFLVFSSNLAFAQIISAKIRFDNYQIYRLETNKRPENRIIPRKAARCIIFTVSFTDLIVNSLFLSPMNGLLCGAPK